MKRLNLGPQGAIKLACILLVTLGSPSLLTGAGQLTDEQNPLEVVQAASHLSLDGLSLIVVFNRQVNLSEFIASVEQQKFSVQTWTGIKQHVSGCFATNSSQQESSTLKIGGIQLCTKLLTRKTLKLLHKYKLYNCIWASRSQLIVELSKPASGPLKLTFQATSSLSSDQELSVELSKMPLESMGVPLIPRLALTGPNQVPPCGQFSLNAHLSSPFGTQLGDALRLSWSVERLGMQLIPSQSDNGSRAAIDQADELSWQSLRERVTRTTSNNLLLDAAHLQQAPQIYEFRLSATFITQITSVTLNATHRVSRLDYETPIGSVYGTHMLQSSRLVNPSQDLLLLAEVQVPDCARSVKQVGLYWQVSDARVQFEQTYAPFYLARANSLPEQLELEFRLNLFYGVRVKRSAQASARLTTAELQPDAPISSGLLAVAMQAEPSGQLVLAASSSSMDRYGHLWSCFDGKTAQTCYKGPPVRSTSLAETNSNSTRYDLAAASQSAASAPVGSTNADASLQPGTPLIEPASRSQQVLRLASSWLEPEAQLWFGLQRFDRLTQNQQASLANARTEYALVSVQRRPAVGAALPSISLGPLLVGRGRVRSTLRNPLTGALVLSAGTAAVLVGRIGPSRLVGSFAWQAPNLIQPIHWSSRNHTNELTGEQEILSELYLPAELQLAHAHHQVRLVACGATSGATIAASLSLDVVPGVSECKIALDARENSQTLQVSVDLCNLPANLAPASYQLYLVNAEPTRPTSLGSSEQDEYLNESDEEQLEGRWQAASVAQLTPVFRLPLGAVSPGSRLAARVCDRLQACRAFYSAPLQLGATGFSGPTSTGLLAADQQVARRASAELLAESARRNQLAGNSLAALASSLAAMELLAAAGSPEAAARDTLHYCAQALLRQFHFTDSGQSSLAVRAMARVLSLPQANIELKYRAARLLGQLTRKSLSEQVNLKTTCAPDWRSLELAYDSLLATFSHYTIVTGYNSADSQQASQIQNNNRQGQARASSNNSTSAAGRKRDEAILAYLRSIRLAQRALVAAAATRLSLGDERQLIYRASAPLQPLVDTNRTTSSSIVSRLAHLTHLSGSISLDLTRDFTAKLTLRFDQQLLAKLNSWARNGQIKCVNVTARSPKSAHTGLCSSFVLAVSSFAGKAPFRALDDGPALRVPMVEVSLLSPIDGSNLLELNEGLAGDFSTLTFSYGATEDSPLASNKRALHSPKRAFKCYRFDETTNEWARYPSSSVAGRVDNDQEQLGEDGQSRQLSCTFDGLGAFAAFQGKPPANDNSLGGLPVGMGAGALIALAGLLSLLGCLASSLRSDKSRSNRGHTGDHPEQSNTTYHRNDFNYPALAGRA